MTNESLYLIVPGEGATGLQKFQHLRNGVGCQLMNLNIVGYQDISKLLRDWQTKPRSEKILKHHALIFSGFRRGLFPKQPTYPRLEATF
jgi:hypothetical protein